jgi:serine/threonine-protein kinase
MRLEPGYQLTPSVKLKRLLRRGGMGAVWEAEHLGLGSTVAVKLMTGSFVEDDPMVLRFSREAACTAQIKSPHVVHIYDHGTNADGLPYIVMELLEGEDLAERLERGGPLGLLELAEVLSQVAKALGKAHQAGIVHRDIKLNNVFLQDVGGEVYAKLLDFGVAKQGPSDLNSLTTTGVLVGTLAYMSPEQLHDAKSVDHRTDLWSLGVLAYRALTGKMPFSDDKGMGALMLAVSHGRFVPPSELRPELPAALDGWFLRALNGDPNRRFQSARELIDAFDAAIGRQASGVRGFDSGVHRPRPPEPTVIEAASLLERRRDASTSAGVARADSVGDRTQPGAARPPRRAAWALGLSLVVVAVLGTVGFLGRAQLFGTASSVDLAAAPQPAPAPEPAAPAKGEAAQAQIASAAAAEPLVAPAAPSAERAVVAASSSARAAAPPTPMSSARSVATAVKSASPPPPNPPVRTGGSLKKERDYGF